MLELRASLMHPFMAYIVTLRYGRQVFPRRFLSVAVGSREALENTPHLRKNDPVIAGQVWVDGWQLVRLL